MLGDDLVPMRQLALKGGTALPQAVTRSEEIQLATPEKVSEVHLPVYV